MRILLVEDNPDLADAIVRRMRRSGHAVDWQCDGLAAAGFDVFRPQATYFVTVDIRPLGESDGMAFCRSLPDRIGVVAVPNVVFHDDEAIGRPLVRFAFCKRLEVIDEAVSRLAKL